MKRGEFSYENGRSQSHASLSRYRRTNQDTLTRQTNKQRPNVKFFTINHQQNAKVVKKTSKLPDRNEEDIRRQNKLLQYELKKKINQNSVLCKFLRTKNNSQLSHIDIYLQMSRMEAEIQEKNEEQKDLQFKVDECTRQLEDLLVDKENQERQHLKIIEDTNFKVERMKEKYKEQLAQQTSSLQKEKKRHEQTRELLSEMQKKYEEIRKENKELKQEIEKQENIKNNEIHELTQESKDQFAKLLTEIQECKDQLQKFKVRQKQNQLIMEEMKSHYQEQRLAQQGTIKTLESELKQKERNNGKLNQKLATNNQQIEKYSQLIKDHSCNQQMLEKQLKQYRQSEHKHLQVIEKLQRDAQQLQNQSKLLVQENSEIGEKMLNLESRIKVLTYERDEQNCIIQKLTNKENQTANRTQELQEKLYLIEKKNTVAHAKIKQLEKIEELYEQTKLSHYRSSKNEMQSYMAIGRLIQLIHQLKSLLNIDTHQNTKEMENSDVTDYISVLTDLLDAFIKTEHQQVVQQNKLLQEDLTQFQSQIKSLLNAYNNYVQDEQISGYSRDLIQSILSDGRFNRKSRNQYIQLILQKLISMTAIKSYASDQASTHHRYSKDKYQNRQGLTSRYKSRESLQNTLQSQYQGHDIKKIYYQKMSSGHKHFREKQRTNDDERENIKRLIRNKLQTEPFEHHQQPKDYIKRLYINYDDEKQNKNKENMMQRLNSKQVSCRNLDKFGYSKGESGESMRGIGRGKRKGVSDGSKNMEDIQKKYFR